MENELVLIIDKQGKTRHLNQEGLPGTDRLGPVEKIYRNSHVEPLNCLSEAAKEWLVRHHGYYATYCMQKPTDWFADMLPVSGPVLGPYDSRPEALQAEIDWLKSHDLPLPKPS